MINDSKKSLINETLVKCSYYYKILSCKQSKYQHQKICKYKNNNIIEEKL